MLGDGRMDRSQRGVNKFGKRPTFLSRCFIHDSFQKLSGRLKYKVCLLKEKKTNLRRVERAALYREPEEEP